MTEAAVDSAIGRAEAVSPLTEGLRSTWLRRVSRNRNVVTGALILLVLVLAALFADVISTHSPTRLFPANRLKPPSAEHYLGTDEFGRDVYSLVVHGSQIERGGTYPHWRGVLDDRGRVVVAICFNMDLGDAWEWADLPDYPEKYASMAYRLGVNYVIYAMTH